MNWKFGPPTGVSQEHDDALEKLNKLYEQRTKLELKIMKAEDALADIIEQYRKNAV